MKHLFILNKLNSSNDEVFDQPGCDHSVEKRHVEMKALPEILICYLC